MKKQIINKINQLFFRIWSFIAPHYHKYVAPHLPEIKHVTKHYYEKLKAEITGTRKRYYKIGAILLVLYNIYGFATGQIGSYFQEGGLPTAIDAERAIRGDITDVITAVGFISSPESVMLTSEVTGTVKEIYFEEGQRIKKGDPIIKIDDVNYQAGLESARSDMELARVTLERYENLAKQNVISKQNLDEARANFRKAKAAVLLAEDSYNKTLIEAPFDGVAGLRNISIGQYLKPGDVITNVENTKKLQVDFSLPEKYIKFIKIGSMINLESEQSMADAISAKIVAVSPLIDKASLAFNARAVLEIGDRDLRPGGYAKVIVPISPRNAVLIPETGMVKTPEGNIAYVLDTKVSMKEFLEQRSKRRSLRGNIFDTVFMKIIEGRTYPVRKVEIYTGLRKDDLLEVTKGIEEGDIVVTAGHLKIGDQSLATISEESEKAMKDKAKETGEAK